MAKVPQELLDKQYRCTGCAVESDGTLFPWYFSKERNCYRHKPKCKKCTREYDRWRKNESPDLRPRYLDSLKRYKAKQKEADPIKYRIKCNMDGYKRRSKKDNTPFSLTVEYLIALYHKQQGKCYYTKEGFSPVTGTGKKSPNSMTLDRLIPSLGYVPNNVAWCIDKVNVAKGNLSEEEFYQFFQCILDYRDYNVGK